MRVFCFTFLALLLITANSVYASPADQSGDPQEYAGTINGNLNITMVLERNGYKLEGEYAYDSQHELLILTGEMIDEQAFILREYYDGKSTGIFRGTFLGDGKVEGQWSNSDGTVQFDFQLIKKAPSTWTGKWGRINKYFDPATLKIWNVRQTGFDFKISASSGGNTGRIDFEKALFTGNTAVYKTAQGACLIFHIQNDKLVIEQEGDISAGEGVVYLGEYQKGNVLLIPPTLSEQKVFDNPVKESAFKVLVGDYYDSFCQSFQLVSKEKDLDQVGASVYHGRLRGLSWEGIIMTTPGGEIWAAITMYNRVVYFTNSKRFNDLPLTIENWRSRFKDREVRVVYKP